MMYDCHFKCWHRWDCNHVLNTCYITHLSFVGFCNLSDLKLCQSFFLDVSLYKENWEASCLMTKQRTSGRYGVESETVVHLQADTPWSNGNTVESALNSTHSFTHSFHERSGFIFVPVNIKYQDDTSFRK